MSYTEERTVTEIGLTRAAQKKDLYPIISGMFSLFNTRFKKIRDDLNVHKERIDTHISFHENSLFISRLEKIEKALEAGPVDVVVQPDKSRTRAVEAEITQILNVGTGRWLEKHEIPDQYFTTAEAGAFLGLSIDDIRTLCRAGVLKADKFGRVWQITKHNIFYYVIGNVPDHTRKVPTTRLVHGVVEEEAAPPQWDEDDIEDIG